MQPLLSYNTNLYIAVTCGAIMKCLPCHIDIFLCKFHPIFALYATLWILIYSSKLYWETNYANQLTDRTSSRTNAHIIF